MRFRKKPVVIDAIQWDGNNLADVDTIADTHGAHRVFIVDQYRLAIETLEGTMTADVGDWIIRGVQGELYPCKPDIFEQTYEEVS